MQYNAFIIIPVHNRKSITLKCLDNLEKNGDLARFRVVVVDDGSTDFPKYTYSKAMAICGGQEQFVWA
jgi:GT2 family glycosyltransferase